MNRRDILKFGAGTAMLPVVAGLPVAAANAPLASPSVHGLSVFGDLKYPADFDHFTYRAPNAPKGGRIVFTAPSWQYNQNPQTFNTLNSFILKGDAPPRMELCFDSLMARALDEPDAMYGLVAESLTFSRDGNTYYFRLRPQARFHDGSPLTAADVAFSLMTLKREGHPNIAQTIREMVSAGVTSDGMVEVVFSGKQTRQLPLTVASLPILSREYYTDNDFATSTMNAPLGSGPYRVGQFEAGRYIEYERVKDWWAADLPVSRGAWNFDVIRIEFFRDHAIAFEGLKKGKLTFYEEFVSKNWATGYDFPALRQGKVIKTTFPDQRPAGAQGWFFNTRRRKFSDPRTREAIGLAFDFEWTNTNIFYGLYQRTESFFENSAMKARGKPSPEELKLLELFRGEIPDATFGEVWTAPKSDGSGQDREPLRRATRLLKQAGWKRQGQRLVSASGEPLTIEFLTNQPTSKRILEPYRGRLALIGVEATIRLIDPSQYEARLNSYDFDVVGQRYALDATPGEGIRQYWGSEAANLSGSHNLAGISDPVVDTLIEKIIHARDREAMTIACRALDRVLRAGHYWVPNWYRAFYTVAYWDMFGHPHEQPRYDFPYESSWWYDEDKARRIGNS